VRLFVTHDEKLKLPVTAAASKWSKETAVFIIRILR
jgi:hypothetical protein